MSRGFTVDPSTRIVSYTAQGILAIDETREFFNAVVAHPHYDRRYNFLGDCRGLTGEPSPLYIHAVTEEVQARAKEFGPCRWALVFASPRAIGAARLCADLTEGSGIKFGLFVTVAEAVGWVSNRMVGCRMQERLLSSR
jgi:hypothetical protein